MSNYHSLPTTFDDSILEQGGQLAEESRFGFFVGVLTGAKRTNGFDEKNIGS